MLVLSNEVLVIVIESEKPMLKHENHPASSRWIVIRNLLKVVLIFFSDSSTNTRNLIRDNYLIHTGAWVFRKVKLNS